MNRATDSFGTASVSHQYSFLFYPRIQRSSYLLRVYQSLEFYRPPFSLSVSLDGSVAVDSVGRGMQSQSVLLSASPLGVHDTVVYH